MSPRVTVVSSADGMMHAIPTPAMDQVDPGRILYQIPSVAERRLIPGHTNVKVTPHPQTCPNDPVLLRSVNQVE